MCVCYSSRCDGWAVICIVALPMESSVVNRLGKNVTFFTMFGRSIVPLVPDGTFFPCELEWEFIFHF